MARPHEPHADAIRTARRIVDEAGSRLVQSAQSGDGKAIADACHDLVVAIAQAIVDAERGATEQGRDDEDAAQDGSDDPRARPRNRPARLSVASVRPASRVEVAAGAVPGPSATGGRLPGTA